MSNEHVSLVKLALDLARAKRDETDAKDRRVAAEAAIVAATGFDKAEGSQTYDRDDEHGTCKLVLKQPITASVDAETWEKTRRTLDPKHPARDIFVRSYKLDTKKARALQDSNPEAWAVASEAITRKPGKIGVDIKQVGTI